MRHGDDLKALRQAEKNRLEAKPRSKTVVRDLEAHVTFLDQQLAALEAEIEQYIQPRPELKQQPDLLPSIPGVGMSSSSHRLAELGDLRRFENGCQIVALVGLNPQQRRSGKRLNDTAGISRMGCYSLRAVLDMLARVAMRHHPILKAFAERMANNGLTPKQVIVAVMRKLLHLAYGVLKSPQPFDPHYLDKVAVVA